MTAKVRRGANLLIPWGLPLRLRRPFACHPPGTCIVTSLAWKLHPCKSRAKVVVEGVKFPMWGCRGGFTLGFFFLPSQFLPAHRHPARGALCLDWVYGGKGAPTLAPRGVPQRGYPRSMRLGEMASMAQALAQRGRRDGEHTLRGCSSGAFRCCK